MQVSVAATYLVLGLADPRFLVGVVVVVAYGAGLATWHEGGQLICRFGADWAYRRAVRPWIPRLRPYAGQERATVNINPACDACGSVGAWIARRRPVALDIAPADPGMRRITYAVEDRTSTGVRAFAMVLQHLHIGWASVGWFLLLPGAGRAVQLCVDAFGGGLGQEETFTAPQPGKPLNVRSDTIGSDSPPPGIEGTDPC